MLQYHPTFFFFFKLHLAKQPTSQHGPGTLGYFREDIYKPIFLDLQISYCTHTCNIWEPFPNTYICTKSLKVPVVQSDLYPRRVWQIHVTRPKRLWYTPYINSQACFLFIFSIKKLRKINQGIKKYNLPASQIFHNGLNKSDQDYKGPRLRITIALKNTVLNLEQLTE